mmetsp:Transcript_41258/g.87922  ORF Transcript_41258/g.87922 Transcript_41258/m.87922 type:complete len:167 (+) Transcript_41258:388-888(+)
MTLTNELQNYIVEVSNFCASSSDGWQIATSVYLLVLLLVSTAIATQNHGIREEFNETRYLALMIYSHFMFTILRLITFLVSDSFSRTYAVSATMSILLSLDILITIGIYFLPKLIKARMAINDSSSANNRGASVHRRSDQASQLASRRGSLRKQTIRSIGGSRSCL